MIELQNLSFGYKRNNLLFSNMQTKFEKGRVYGLLGENGAGKTTMLKLMCGLHFPKKGNVLINSEQTKNRSTKMLSNLFFLPEIFAFPELTIKKYLKIYSPFYPKFNATKFYNSITEFKIEKNSKLNKLSYGQKKKILISFGLATETNIILSDEPTNGLDIPARRTFKKMLTNSIDENKTIIISTHQIADIQEIIDAIVILNNGKIIFNQTFDEINEKIKFDTADSENDPDILYARKNFTNFEVIKKNKTKQHSNINIELLFEALTNQNAHKITEQFN